MATNVNVFVDRLFVSRVPLCHDIMTFMMTISINSIPDESATNRLISITGSANVERLNEVLAQTQKLAGIGTLTASVAHELNTPISIITATCGNLLHEMDDQNLNAETLLRYVKMIEQSAWRCARIVGVLRNYTVEDTLQRGRVHPLSRRPKLALSAGVEKLSIS